VSSSNARLTRWRLAGVIAAVGAFVIAGAGTGSAATFGSPYQVPLDPSTTTPVKAADFSPTGGCDGIVPANEDGWHFAVPDTFSAIVSLDLTFNSRPGALGVVFTQDRQQAFVATLPGAQLMQASATVMTADGEPQIQSFKLASTCPAQMQTAWDFPSGTATRSPSAMLPIGTDTPCPTRC
jgi:hypothetical protein